MAPVSITHFSDPACPWAYSASPALAVLRWRYGAQLDWRLVTIGLSEDPARYVERGYTPTRMAIGNLSFRAILERFPAGLTSQEVAAIMAPNNQAVDRPAAERALVELVGAGGARRTPLGDDAIWQPA